MNTNVNDLSPTLPRWIRESRRGVDWGVLLAILLSAACAWAFLLQPGLPRTNASENYVFRTADYAQTLLEGRLYPRWSPNVFSGYGSPIPNFFPPAAPYTAALLQIFLTDNPVDAVRVLYLISLTLAGTMMYVFVTRRADASAGILAAVLYVYSPYVGMTAPHVLGDLPGVMALALLPALLWSIDRLLVLNRPQDFPLVVFTMSLLLLTDLRYAVVALGLSLLFVFWHSLRVARSFRWLFVIAAIVLGLLLSSFYWVPALLELGEVHWLSSPVPPLNAQLTLTELFTPLAQVDLGQMVLTPQLTLGLTHISFALLGLVGFVLYRSRVRFQLFFFVIGIAVLVSALLLFPRETWLLGVVMLCLSISSSGFVLLRERLLPRLFLPVVIITALATSSAVWLSPLWPDDFGDVSPLAQVDYERQDFGIAVLPAGTSVPSTLVDTLQPNRFLLEGYQSGRINKILPEQITPSLQVGTLAHYTHEDSVQITTTLPTTLEILTAYFPGWSANLGAASLFVGADPTSGLIEISIPETRSSELTIALDTTLVRTAAWVMSGSTLLCLIFMAWFRLRRSNSL
ncbi:MAG: 6-pyruvoyl-tetrahydropterin synthase-related protein, partial [Anaerolineae bacterium]